MAGDDEEDDDDDVTSRAGWLPYADARLFPVLSPSKKLKS